MVAAGVADGGAELAQRPGNAGGGVGEEGAAAHWRGRGVREEGVHPGGAAKESDSRVCGPAMRWRRSQRGG